MTTKKSVSAGDALIRTLISPNEDDRNLEAANVVDGLFAIARSINSVAKALNKLGLADASTPMGAIEMLSKEIQDQGLAVSGAIDNLASSVSDVSAMLRPTEKSDES